MGKVLLNLKVRPENPEVDLNKIKDEIKNKLDIVKETKEKELAFGMKELHVLLMFKEEPGGTDKYENIVKDIEGVKSVETGEITLL